MSSRVLLQKLIINNKQPSRVIRLLIQTGVSPMQVTPAKPPHAPGSKTSRADPATPLPHPSAHYKTAQHFARTTIKQILQRREEPGALAVPCESANSLPPCSDEKANIARIDFFDEESEYLTTEFCSQWAKMDSAKRDTFYKLRNKFVKRFPAYRGKYKEGELEQPEQQPLPYRAYKTEHSVSLGKSTTSAKVEQRKQPRVDTNKIAYFYSRSKKKCMFSSFANKEAPDQPKEAPVPKMSFMSYMKRVDERKRIKSHKVYGHNMMKTQHKIMNLEKEGTKSFVSLKRCLEDAIEDCIRKR